MHRPGRGARISAVLVNNLPDRRLLIPVRSSSCNVGEHQMHAKACTMCSGVDLIDRSSGAVVRSGAVRCNLPAAFIARRPAAGDQPWLALARCMYVQVQRSIARLDHQLQAASMTHRPPRTAPTNPIRRTAADECTTTGTGSGRDLIRPLAHPPTSGALHADDDDAMLRPSCDPVHP